MRKPIACRCLAVLATLILTLVLVPAAEAATADPTPPPEPTISISPGNLSLPQGRTGKLTAVIANVENATVTWTSGNESVATVDNTGEVTAVARGSTTITASIKVGDETYAAQCSVSVTYAELDHIKIEPETASESLSFGSTGTLTVTKVTAYWSAGDSTDITDMNSLNWYWSSENTSVVQVPSSSSSGSKLKSIGVQAVGVGTAKVTARVTYQGKSAEAVFTVNVGQTTRVIIQEYDAAVRTVHATVTKDSSGNLRGDYKELSALVAIGSETFDDKAVKWTSSDSTVVEIRNGYTGTDLGFTPKKAGQTVITATYEYEDADGKTQKVESSVTCIVTEKNTGGTTPGGDDDDNTTTELPDGMKVLIMIDSPALSANETRYVMEPGSTTLEATVTLTDTSGTSYSGKVEWNRDGKAVATCRAGKTTYNVAVNVRSSQSEVVAVSSSGTRGSITAGNPGEAEVILSVTTKAGTTTATLPITVSGFELLKEEVTVYENQSLDPFAEGTNQIIKAYGNANTTELGIWSDASNIATYVDRKIAGYAPGETTFTVSDSRRGFRANFKVTVKADESSTISGITIKRSETLKFSTLMSQIGRQAGGDLSYITGLSVDPAKGTLYYNYKSESAPGQGVGAESYYLNPPTSGQRAIKDLTFVPNPTFVGGEAVISYTAVSKNNKNYVCKIIVTIEPEGGDSAAIALETDYNTPLKFTGAEFNRVCQERLGSKLNYVIFSQPPERQGKLYTNYTGTGNYGSVVDTARKYTLKELDTISFVPAPGYSGPVTVYYTAYGTGSSGSYAGQVSINVKPEGGVAISGLAYDIPKGGVAHFDDEDFNDYCREILYEENRYDRQTLSFIRFDSLPSESEGVLYYDYRSSANLGTRAVAGTSYYYGTRVPRIDRLAFVAAEGFTGTVKIPFTGWTADGTSFGGNVEINVRSGTGSGDIYYTCLPGRTVSFRASDFTSLSNRLTGRTIDYIVFRSLPSSVDGSLYYGSSRITSTGTQYRNSNIGRLSFRAANTFSGVVDIPFEGRSASGATFQGVITIGTNGSGSSGSSSGSNIRYNADSGTTAVFARVDFDDLSRWQTDRSVSSVRFTPPSSSQGTLYRNYRSNSNMGTRITSDTSINASDLDRVAFVPASGFNGTAYIDFVATASSNGGTFAGTVEVVVGRYGSNFCYFSDMYGYSDAQQAAVNFLYDRNITRGLTETQYGPQNSIRRGDFARMIYQAFAFSPSGVNQAFVDVAPGVYYAEAVNALYSRGVVSGVGGGYYAPDSTLTRQDAICMVQRAMRVTGRTANDGNTSALYSYSDGGSVAGYAQGAMAFAVQNGYLPTYSGWLNPTQPLTRVDMAEILYRVLNS